MPNSVLNCSPQDRLDDLIEFALEHEALTTRELEVKYIDEKRYFFSGSSAYRVLIAADPITTPDYVVIKPADEFTDKTTAINQIPLSGSCFALPFRTLGQTDFTYFKMTGCGRFYLLLRRDRSPFEKCLGWNETVTEVLSLNITWRALFRPPI